MLVLTRKPGESIEFPELEITVHFLQVLGMNSMKIGVEAPRDINIIRSEVKPLLPVVEKPQRATSPDDGCEDDCDVDLSPQSAPMKKLGSAVFLTRKNIEDNSRKNKNADYED